MSWVSSMCMHAVHITTLHDGREIFGKKYPQMPQSYINSENNVKYSCAVPKIVEGKFSSLEIARKTSFIHNRIHS